MSEKEFKHFTVKDPNHADVFNEKVVDPAIELKQNTENLQQTVTAHLADYTQFKDSKGQAEGLAELDEYGKVPLVQLPEIKSGVWEEIFKVDITSHVAALNLSDLDLEEYKRLKILFALKESENYEDHHLYIRFNEDTGNNYSYVNPGKDSGVLNADKLVIKEAFPRFWQGGYGFGEIDIQNESLNNINTGAPKSIMCNFVSTGINHSSPLTPGDLTYATFAGFWHSADGINTITFESSYPGTGIGNGTSLVVMGVK